MQHAVIAHRWARVSTSIQTRTGMQAYSSNSFWIGLQVEVHCEGTELLGLCMTDSTAPRKTGSDEERLNEIRQR